MPTDPTQIAPERNRYFYGLMMDAERFSRDQAYFNGKRQLLNRFVTGAGVVSGLGLTLDSATNLLTLQPGLAIDGAGREILVPAAVPIDLTNVTDNQGTPTGAVPAGSTVLLSLAYAERYPERVSGMILVSVTSTRRLELDWLYRGAGRFFPEAWARFRDYVGAADYRLPTDTEPPIEDLLMAYSRLMENPDPDIRARAATEWLAWEDAVISQESNGQPGQYSNRPDAAKLAFVRICAHYFANDGFLEDGVLIRDAGKLAGIPGVLIHGRSDLSGGVITAWELAHAWPGAELIVIEDSGHTGSATMQEAMPAAADRLFAEITERTAIG